MRCKIQARNGAGLFQDIIIDPSARNMLALDFTPRDLEYIERRQKANGSKERLHLAMVPFRLKTRVTGPKGLPLDIIARRSELDWIALELTPDDVHRLIQIRPGPNARMIVYAGPPGKDIVTKAQVEKFKEAWPEITSDDDCPPLEELGGIPQAMALNMQTADAFRLWAQEWPPQFHASHKAPESKLILPNGVVKDGD